jgi:hypothetical protein
MPAIPFGTTDPERRKRIEEKKASIRAEMCTCRPAVLREQDSPLDPDCPVHGNLKN